MHPAPWGAEFFGQTRRWPYVWPNLDEVGHVLRCDLLSTVAEALGEDLFLPAAFHVFLGAKNGRKAHPVSISFLKAWHVFFSWWILFSNWGRLPLCTLNCCTLLGERYMIPLPSLCLLKHDYKTKFTNMTHLICLGPNSSWSRFASETKNYICLLTCLRTSWHHFSISSLWNEAFTHRIRIIGIM